MRLSEGIDLYTFLEFPGELLIDLEDIVDKSCS